jgi:tetratricopeptide (TPR) repeat protein
MAGGKLADAEGVLNALRRNQPNAPIVHAQFGMLRQLKGDSQAARAAYARALALDAGSLEAIAGLVSLDVAAGKPVDARTRLEQAVSRQPDSVPLRLMAGRSYAALGDHAAAERSARRAIELEPSRPDGYDLLSQVYRLESRLGDAIAELEMVAERSPTPAVALTAIGGLLEKQQKFDEARARYEQALKADTASPVAANNLAWLIAERGGDLDLALKLAQSAVAGLPASPQASDTLGWVYYKSGLFPQAVSTLKKAVASAPAAPAYKYHLGLSYAKAGQGRLAAETLRTAVQLDPGSPLADDAREALKDLAAFGY